MSRLSAIMLCSPKLRVALVSLGILVSAGSLGCSKESSEGEGRPAKIKAMPAAEVQRAKMACEGYAARVCSCAEANPELVRKCDLAKASPGALQINLDLLASEGLEVAEQQAVKVEARRIAAVCFEADAKLDIVTCPRKSK
ncbi:MAG: hypothetical protein GY811_01565 [Myxococcales bacterium]|nr:hypothetical protein [Myxococcales bacterium]